MAAIARDDIKMTLLQDFKGPIAPTAAEPNGGYDLINAVSITYLSKIRPKGKGGSHGWALRSDNADPVTLPRSCPSRNLCGPFPVQVSRMIAEPGAEHDYEHNVNPLPQVVFARSDSGFQSQSRELSHLETIPSL